MSTDPDMPLADWEMVSEVSIFANTWVLEAEGRPNIRHYLYARLVFLDGKLSEPSVIVSVVPGKEQVGISARKHKT